MLNPSSLTCSSERNCFMTCDLNSARLVGRHRRGATPNERQLEFVMRDNHFNLCKSLNQSVCMCISAQTLSWMHSLPSPPHTPVPLGTSTRREPLLHTDTSAVLVRAQGARYRRVPHGASSRVALQSACHLSLTVVRSGGPSRVSPGTSMSTAAMNQQASRVSGLLGGRTTFRVREHPVPEAPSPLGDPSVWER